MAGDIYYKCRSLSGFCLGDGAIDVDQMMHDFVLPFPPKPKERARPGKSGKFYTPKSTSRYEKQVGETYEGPMFDGPLYVDLELYGDKTLVSIETIYGLGVDDRSPLRGDIDNYIKSILDGLNGRAWHDDKQITIVRAEKVLAA